MNSKKRINPEKRTLRLDWWRGDPLNSCFMLCTHFCPGEIEKRARGNFNDFSCSRTFVCPVCYKGGLVVSPNAKPPAGGKWYCFTCKKGGDSFALLGHFFQIDRKDVLKKLGTELHKDPRTW